MMDDEDDELMMEMTEEMMAGEGPAQEKTRDKWSRPAPPSLNPATDKLVFQQVTQQNLNLFPMISSQSLTFYQD